MKNSSLEHRVCSFELIGRKPKPETRNQRASAIAALMGVFLALSAVGCGYQFATRGDQFPKDVHNVFVQLFINRTKEVGLEREITTALRSELHRRGELRVVDQPGEADAILSGVVRALGSRVVGVNQNGEALQIEMTLVLDASLRRRSPEEVLWRAQAARFSDLYSGSRGAVVTSSSDFQSRTLNPADLRQFTDVQLTETLKREARDRLTGEAARELHARLLEMF